MKKRASDRGKPQRWRRWTFRVGIALGVVVALGVSGVAVAYPAVTAMNCPGCYGMTHAGNDIYVDSEMTQKQRREATDVIAAAKHRVAQFYAGSASDPRVLVCGSEDCYARIGGGQERGVAVMGSDLMLSPRGTNIDIAAHELSHVELAERLDGAQVPQWFDEGLAVTVADDRRWLKPESASDRCTARAAGQLPRTLDDWLREASADKKMYARVACEVVTWMDAEGGRTAVRGLVKRVAAGEKFDDVFGEH